MTTDVLIRDPEGLLLFWCPGCEMPHGVWVAKPNERTGASWKWNGSMSKPTFTPSLLLWLDLKGGPVQCHSFITDGMIRFLPDSAHKLSGQIVPLMPFYKE